jgi:heat shock protein HslJ
MKLLRSGFILLLALFMLATCSQVSEPPSGEWRLMSLNENPVVEGTHISLTFGDEQVSGSAGCNSYGGTFDSGGEGIEIANLTMTLMACTDAGVMAQESAYLAALQAVETFKVEDELLVLSGPEVELVFGR